MMEFYFSIVRGLAILLKQEPATCCYENFPKFSQQIFFMTASRQLLLNLYPTRVKTERKSTHRL